MKVVLRAALSRFAIEPLDRRPERARRRSITISPAEGAVVILRERREGGAFDTDSTSLAGVSATA
jgi:hypothetical protein